MTIQVREAVVDAEPAQWLAEVGGRLTAAERTLVAQALALASECYAGRHCRDGEPLLGHCREVATILDGLHMEGESLAAALLSAMPDLVTGWPDLEPLGPFGTITDSLSPRFVALLVTSALLHKRRTGRGQYIDLSQVEGGIVCLTETVVTYAATGEALGRIGNRSRHIAPHGVFPCAGEDRWISIAVMNDEEWQGLVAATENAAWTQAADLGTQAGRLRSIDRLHQNLAEWTRAFDDRALAERLQSHGVAAAPVLNVADLLNDPSNCGACGSPCKEPGKNQARTCKKGVCAYECAPGFADCNGDPSDGCEVDLSIHPAHCGACDVACDVAAGQPCIEGKCLMTECDAGVTR